ncbi:MAG: hypothetical protein AB1352_02405 [Patescibacteria group bacterium]
MGIQFCVSRHIAENSTTLISQREALRQGDHTASLLVCLSHASFADRVWKQLATHFFASQGTLDAALEHAGNRVNEWSKELPSYTESVCALAYGPLSFALACGGENYAYLLSRGRFIEVCQSEYSVGRKKIFTEFVTGTHKEGTFLITTKKPSTSELAQLARALISGDKKETHQSLDTLPTALLVSACEKKSLKDKALQVQKTILSFPLPRCRNNWRAIIAPIKNTSEAGKACIPLLRKPWVSTDGTARYRGFIRAITGLIRQSSYKKRIIIGVISLVVLISLRLIFTSIGSKNVERIIAETVRREAQIESLLKDNKEDDALSLIDATLSLLNAAPQHLSDAQTSTIKNLRTRLAQRAALINKLSLIADPKPVVSVEKSFREAHVFDLVGLALMQGKLYSVNRAEGAVYEFDGKERRIIVMTELPQGAGTPIDIIVSTPGTVMVLTKNPLGVLRLDAERREFQFIPLTLPRPTVVPIAYATFQNRLYLLDARTRAIYRFERTPQGYNLWSPWSKDDMLDLSQATTFAIDGSIYVTFTDHSIIRLEKGKRVPFALTSIQPPLQNVTAIATKEDSPYLYLLDKPQRRVVVILKKDGSLVAQYTSPLFTDLRGLYPDEAARRIYVLNGDTIYSVGPDDRSITDS